MSPNMAISRPLVRRGTSGGHHAPLERSSGRASAKWRGRRRDRCWSTSNQPGTGPQLPGAQVLPLIFWPADHPRSAPASVCWLRRHLREVCTAPIPRDCTDGFGIAYWARPLSAAHPEVQAGMSWLAMLSPADRERGAARLRDDLESGERTVTMATCERSRPTMAGTCIVLAGGDG